MRPITINKALLLQEGILRFELSWTAVYKNIPLKSFWQEKAVCCKVEFPQNHKLSEMIIVKISSTIRSY
jgi:hypothetical protein